MKWFFFVFCCRCCFRFAFGCPFALMRALLDWHCWMAKCKNYNKKIEMKWKKKRRRKKRWQWQRQQYAYLAQFNIDLETIHFNSIHWIWIWDFVEDIARNWNSNHTRTSHHNGHLDNADGGVTGIHYALTFIALTPTEYTVRDVFISKKERRKNREKHKKKPAQTMLNQLIDSIKLHVFKSM